MYVRWQRRRRAQWWHDAAPPSLLIASLVTSRRINGQPRQQHVVYLASIHSRVHDRIVARETFWRTAMTKLDTLDLTSAERARIEDRLQAVVPRLTAEQEADLAANREAIAVSMAAIEPRERSW